MIKFEDFFRKYDKSKQFNEQYYIAEIAGRDSIAAIITALNKYNIKKIFPTAIFHSGLYGDLSIASRNVNFLKKFTIHKEINCEIETLISLDISTLFNSVILKTLTIIQKHYGFFTPCVSCHLLLHLMRVPIAKYLRVNRVITGERELHDKIIKINQKGEILELFKSLLKNQEIELIQPIRKISIGREISTILGENWSNEEEQYNCIFSGSYTDENGELIHNSKDLIMQINDFYYPLFLEIVNYISSNFKVPYSNWISDKIRNYIVKVK